MIFACSNNKFEFLVQSTNEQNGCNLYIILTKTAKTRTNFYTILTLIKT